MIVRFLAEAEAELDAAFAFYESRVDGLGTRFVGEIAAAVDLVRDNPKASVSIGRRFRRRQLRHFPYGLIYAELPGEITIIAVAHLHRRPGYWKGRTRSV